MKHDMYNILDALKMSLVLNNQNSIFFTIIAIIFTTILSSYSIEDLYEYININHYKIKKICLDGKTTTRSGEYTCRIDNLFSDRFKALWYYINTINNKSITSIKEYSMSCNNYNDSRMAGHREETQINNNDFFIVNQKKKFYIGDDIYCTVKFSFVEPDGASSKKCNVSIENINLEIFSYKHDTTYLLEFIDKITNDYLSKVQNNRKDKLFIYTLKGKDTNSRDDYYHNANEIWEECEFNSTRNFNNLFFDSKLELISKINFFQNNKSWYEKNGHPYTLGIGLSGPPGTGKTSIIKCIANMLKRHLIVIPLNKITTQKEFSEYYFEKTYNSDNKSGSINFDNKIIVLEDIDCMTNIVKKRKLQNNKIKNTDNTSSLESSDDDDDKDSKKNDLDFDNINNDKVFKKLNKLNKKMNNDFCMVSEKNNDKITLSYLLNVIDGIRETPGRILIITSNQYDLLDEALVRPGRIDLRIEMNNASVNTISQMYCHYYDEVLEPDFIEKLSDYKISPATITNLFLNSKNKYQFKDKIIKYFQ